MRQTKDKKIYHETHKESESRYNQMYYKSHNRRGYYLERNYGITVEDYNKLFDLQGGYCPICGRHQTVLNRPLSVDHNHDTGEIRGLLCDNCNTALGKLNDSPELVEKALSYLKK